MKIIIATPLYPPEIDSLANYAENTAQRLTAKHQVTVLAYAGKTRTVSGFSLEVVDKNKPLFSRLWQFTLRLSALAKKADIVFAQNAVAAGLPASIVRKWRKFSLVINFSEDEAWKRALALRITDKPLGDFLQSSLEGKTRQLVKIQGWSLRRADQIIVPNQELAEVAIKYYKVNSEKIIIIPTPISKKEVLPFSTDKVARQLYLNTKIYLWANLENLVAALSLLSKDFPEIKLYLAGDGQAKEKLVKVAKELGVSDQVIFLGKISTAQDQYLRETSEVTLKNIAKLSVQELVEEIKLALSSKAKEVEQMNWEEYLQRLNNVLQILIK